MKSLFLHLTSATSTFALLTTAHAVLSSSSGPSCGAPVVDDSYFSVVGVQGTGVHPRQELRDLEKDTETWNMFLQALVRFQAMDQNEKTSYYQIAGIHGVPFVPWDRVTGQADQEMMGYCPHVSSLFGSWHRPYLALFEQILHDRAVDIANEYPSGEAREKAMETANKVRLPYWDWAANPTAGDGVVPSSVRQRTVTVTHPNGTRSEIANPLYRYEFHPLKYDDFAPLSQFEFKDWNHTIRYPLDGFAVNATSRNDEVNERIVKQQPNLRDMLYKLLTTYQPFNEVSNKANGGKIGNFETLHDGLHSVFGLGHMGIIEVAAFDPIFWFHHCNMDRIVAMYQYRYPDTWIEEADQAMGSYYVKKGSAQGVDSPLAPFHMNADGDMWTSTTVRNLTSFGYTYPELMGNPSNETFTSSLNKLYKPQAQGLNDTSVATESLGSGYGKNTTQATEWLCEVNMPADIKISYSVRAFLGEPDADPKKWSTDNNYVGQLATLSSSRMKTDVIITGSIGLTQKLAQKYESGELQSLNKADVAAYLKTNFHWRIQAFDHSEIPRNKPPAGLNVTVYNVPIQIPLSDTEVPTRDGDAEYDHEIDGNPPVYNGPGIDGTNSTAPASEVGGSYNGTSGEFEWRNDTNTEQSSTLQVVSRTTQAVPDNAWATSLALSWGSAPSRAASSAEVPEASSPVVTSAAPNAEAPEPTMPPGPQTRYVTSVIMEYVTL